MGQPDLARRLVAEALGTLLLVRNVMGSNPQNIYWRSLPRFSDYIGAHLVRPEVHYRVLTMSNQEDGLTQLVQAGETPAQADEVRAAVCRHAQGFLFSRPVPADDLPLDRAATAQAPR